MKLLTRRPAPLPCREVVEMVTDYFEDALPRRERARLEAHLADCPHCSAYLEQLRVVHDVAGRIEPESVSPEARDALGRVFAEWAAEGGR